MRITRLGDPLQARPAARSGASQGGFATLVESDAATRLESAPAGAARPPTAAAAPDVAEALPDAEERDSRARKQGAAMLRALANLQAGLLGGSLPAARLALADLAGDRLRAADPALEEALKAIEVRAAVERAKAGTP